MSSPLGKNYSHTNMPPMEKIAQSHWHPPPSLFPRSTRKTGIYQQGHSLNPAHVKREHTYLRTCKPALHAYMFPCFKQPVFKLPFLILCETILMRTVSLSPSFDIMGCKVCSCPEEMYVIWWSRLVQYLLIRAVGGFCLFVCWVCFGFQYPHHWHLPLGKQHTVQSQGLFCQTHSQPPWSYWHWFSVIDLPAMCRALPLRNLPPSHRQPLSLLLADRTVIVGISRLRECKRNMSRFSPPYCCGPQMSTLFMNTRWPLQESTL